MQMLVNDDDGEDFSIPLPTRFRSAQSVYRRWVFIDACHKDGSCFSGQNKKRKWDRKRKREKLTSKGEANLWVCVSFLRQCLISDLCDMNFRQKYAQCTDNMDSVFSELNGIARAHSRLIARCRSVKAYARLGCPYITITIYGYSTCRICRTGFQLAQQWPVNGVAVAVAVAAQRVRH